jgi:hypothetical protein
MYIPAIITDYLVYTFSCFSFVHVYESVIEHNQYGVSAIHYSNLTFEDGTVLNRWSEEKIWFQKVSLKDNHFIFYSGQLYTQFGSCSLDS